MIPGLYFLGLQDSNRKLLNNIGYQNGPMYIQLATTVLHFVWCYLLVDVMELGATGAGFATTFTHFLTMAGIYIYTEMRLDP
jgi:Na+-driven multidrug efflux pump